MGKWQPRYLGSGRQICCLILWFLRSFIGSTSIASVGKGCLLRVAYSFDLSLDAVNSLLSLYLFAIYDD